MEKVSALFVAKIKQQTKPENDKGVTIKNDNNIIGVKDLFMKHLWNFINQSSDRISY